MMTAELLIRAAAGDPVALPPTLARQLLAASDDAELAAVLGLSRPARSRMRNDALVEAAQILGADGCTTWQTAQRLAQAARRFERALWPALQAGQALPLSPHELALWRAYQVQGVRPIRSPRKLYDLIMIHG